MNCIVCGKRAYSEYCMQHKPRKPIPKRGKKAIKYNDWVKSTAIPYLDETYGRICAACGGSRCGNRQLDIDHKLNRGSHPELVMDLTNVQYLGRFPCHYEKTNNINKEVDNELDKSTKLV